jgi:DNA repair protein SbcC/Rad50
MIPKRVVLENFLSHGEPATDLRFAADEPLWVLCGPNGVGKSAVFDAITYALFGCHRGGAGRGMEELIRHGTNGFRVVCEFGFGGMVYRITRTYNLRGRTTQKVEQWIGPAPDDWQAVPNVNSVAELKAWTEQTLGLGFDAFTASVLLRQGEADKIITAGGAERLALLKKIIGVDRFEELSKRVHGATTSRKIELDGLRKRKDDLAAVTTVELTAATDKSMDTETKRTTAHDFARAAHERVIIAKRWAELDVKRRRLGDQIQAADLRAIAAEQIRADKTRLDDLTTAVPILRKAVDLRGRLALATNALTDQRHEQTRLTGERDRLSAAVEQERQKAETHRIAVDGHTTEANRLRGEIGRETKFVSAADAVAELRRELKTIPADLDEQLTKARLAVATAESIQTAAGKTKAEATGLLKQAKSQQKSFATVGATCSLCGQTVTDEHAEAERNRLATLIGKHDATIAAADDAEDKAAGEKIAAERERDQLDQRCRLRATVTESLSEKESLLSDLGVTADADQLRSALAAKAIDAAEHERLAGEAESARNAAANEANRLVGEHTNTVNTLNKLDGSIRAADLAITKDQATYDGLAGRLSVDWQSKLDGLDLPSVEQHDVERDRLAKSNVAEQFRQLEQDAIQRTGWANQLTDVAAEIAAIPADARIAVADAEDAARQADRDAAKALKARDDAVSEFSDLSRRDRDYKKLTSDIAAAERQHDLHHKLDGLLGKSGLQRELVRTAEREIVHLANDTVQNLSDGDLSIELDDAPDGDDKAFALRVRRADDGIATPVNYLSGSQKFRVAVAVALAIGRYAAGQARPLESVIIDEGFGSLDKDGLRAMADELNQLQRTQSLKRIVLVSHSEEFASRFPVGYRLAHGDTGTMATAFRQ